MSQRPTITFGLCNHTVLIMGAQLSSTPRCRPAPQRAVPSAGHRKTSTAVAPPALGRCAWEARRQRIVGRAWRSLNAPDPRKLPSTKQTASPKGLATPISAEGSVWPRPVHVRDAKRRAVLAISLQVPRQADDRIAGSLPVRNCRERQPAPLGRPPTARSRGESGSAEDRVAPPVDCTESARFRQCQTGRSASCQFTRRRLSVIVGPSHQHYCFPTLVTSE